MTHVKIHVVNENILAIFIVYLIFFLYIFDLVDGGLIIILAICFCFFWVVEERNIQNKKQQRNNEVTIKKSQNQKKSVHQIRPRTKPNRIQKRKPVIIQRPKLIQRCFEFFDFEAIIIDRFYSKSQKINTNKILNQIEIGELWYTFFLKSLLIKG